jgi:hypothetical protein
MTRRRNARSCHRPWNVAAVATAESALENRCLLTQLTPLVEFSNYPTPVAETSEFLLLANTRMENGKNFFNLISKDDGRVVIDQEMGGGASRMYATVDLRTIAVLDLAFGSGPLGKTSRITILQLNQASTNYDLVADLQDAGVQTDRGDAIIVVSGGVYFRNYSSTNGYRLRYVPAAPESVPHDVFSGSDEFFRLRMISGKPVAITDVGSFDVLSKDGQVERSIVSNGSLIALRDTTALVVSSNSVAKRLAAVDLATGSLQQLVTVPHPAGFSLISDASGPMGTSVITVSDRVGTLVITTDGTLAGTRTVEVGTGFESAPASPGIVVAETSTAYIFVNGYALYAFDLLNGDSVQLGDFNPFGADRIRNLTRIGDDIWFTAQIEDGRLALFRFDGIAAVREYALQNWGEFSRVFDFDGRTAILEASYFGVLPGFGPTLYVVDTSATDLAAGPSQINVSKVSNGGTIGLQIDWSAVPEADYYEVKVSAWYENGYVYIRDLRPLVAVKSTIATKLTVSDTLVRGYGWHVVSVRGVSETNVPTSWVTKTFALTSPPRLPVNSLLVAVDGEWRLATEKYWVNEIPVRVYWSDSISSGPIVQHSRGSRLSLASDSSPFPGVSRYYYTRLAIRDDGDYTIEFGSAYIDVFPDTRDNSLPAAITRFPMSVRNGILSLAPTSFTANPNGRKTSLSWNGTALPGEPGLEVWVDDISRGIPRVIRETVLAHSMTTELPNGRYRGWAGRKDPVSGVIQWSPATEFNVANPPLVIAPNAVTLQNRPNFEWTGDPAGRYEVWLNNLTTRERVFRGIVDADRKWSPEVDLSGGRYAFWVRELITDGSVTSWSDARVVQKLQTPIQITAGLMPGVDQTPTISWQPNPRATSYEIWISNDGDSSPVYRRTGLVAETHRVDVPLGNGEFKVWVRAHLTAGPLTSWSDGSMMQIGAPVALVVSGNVLSWQPAAKATHYELWIDYNGGEDARQARIVHETFYFDSNYTLPNSLPRGRYTAWVRAIRAESGELYQGRWSNATEFTVTTNVGIQKSDWHLAVIQDEFTDAVPGEPSVSVPNHRKNSATAVRREPIPLTGTTFLAATSDVDSSAPPHETFGDTAAAILLDVVNSGELDR